MASYIDWYLIELGRRLNGQMPSEPLFSFVSEVEDHLRLKKDDLTGAGMDGPQAEKAAVESFGSPDSVALEALDGGVSHERIARGSVVSLAALILLWVMILAIASSGASLDTPFIAGGIGAVSIIVFMVGSAMSRQWQWKRVLAISGVGAVLVSFLLPSGFKQMDGRLMAIYTLNSDIGWRTRELINLGKVSQGLQKGLAFYQQLDSVKGDLTKMTLTAPKYSNGSFVLLPKEQIDDPSEMGLPSQFAAAAVGEVPPYSRYGPNGPEPWSTGKLVEAKKNWLAYGPIALKFATQREGTARGEVEHLKVALQSSPRFSGVYLGMGLSLGFASACVLLALNGLSVSFSRYTRRRRIRKALVA